MLVSLRRDRFCGFTIKGGLKSLWSIALKSDNTHVAYYVRHKIPKPLFGYNFLRGLTLHARVVRYQAEGYQK